MASAWSNTLVKHTGQTLVKRINWSNTGQISERPTSNMASAWLKNRSNTLVKHTGHTLVNQLGKYWSNLSTAHVGVEHGQRARKARDRRWSKSGKNWSKLVSYSSNSGQTQVKRPTNTDNVAWLQKLSQKVARHWSNTTGQTPVRHWSNTF
jgi:hypothetical protein